MTTTIVSSLLLLLLATAATASSTPDGFSYSFVGDGFCTTRENDGDYYDYIHFDQVVSEEQCGSAIYCGRPFVRGFSYNEGTKWCYCFVDDEWTTQNAIPADMQSLPGHSPLPFVSGTARGTITHSNEQEWFKCFVNNQFGMESNTLYYLVGDGSCTTTTTVGDDADQYNYVSYAQVTTIDTCALYCRNDARFRGFSYDDANNCDCFFDGTAELADVSSLTVAPSQWTQLPGYIYSYFGNTGRGTIQSSDQESMVRKCYSNDHLEEKWDPSNPSGRSISSPQQQQQGVLLRGS
eukprot:CAMPEP_0194246458 /NCGR_PEP_ID=MMETSP0158-20130606/15021_1 /TAXON_ID=33649 /ORGANISM="Thalassionema nitzschioides, Strain L26-B" /LENGTH=292 /DNA_ID=CAMNT_0038982353 /DNA_START=95 /DNA_END=970 /DNA_ORIENTATION=+